MRLSAPYKYQMRDMGRSIGVFYLVVVALMLVFSILVAVDASGTVQVGMSFDGVSFIFLFVLGLCTYKEYFLYFVQNGVSRRSFFVSKLLAMVTVCVGFALVDQVLNRLFIAMISNDHLFVTGVSTAFNPGIGFLGQLAYSICANLLTFAAGSFITVMFYRLNKTGKLLVGIGVPVLLFIGLPIFLSYMAMTNSHLIISVLNSISDFIALLFGSVARICAVHLVGTAVIMALAWLIQRRAVVKNS